MSTRGLQLLALAGLLVVGGLGAVEEQGETEPVSTGHSVEITGTTLDADTGVLRVDGEASFVDTPHVVMTDPAGDARAPGAGLDLVELEITRPDPFRKLLRFRLGIEDTVPEGVVTTPELSTYIGTLQVGGTTEVDLQAWRSAQWNNPGTTDPYFSVNTCEESPTGSTCSTAQVAGSFEDGSAQWLVPLGVLSAGDGDRIRADIFASSPGAAGLVWYGAGATANHDQMFFEDDYEVPAPTLAVELLDADGETVRAESSTPTDAAFSFDLATSGLGAGDYQLVVEGCYQEACVEASRPVTLGG